MGRIIRRFARFHEMDFVGKVVGGTYAIPMAQTEAAQKGIECVLNAGALGGDINGALLGVIGAATLTGTLAAVRPRINVLTGVVVTGTVYGINCSVYARGTASISGNFIGARIAMQNDNTVTQTGDVRGLSIDNLLNLAPVTYEMIRCEENGTAVPISILSAYASPDVTYAFIFSGAKSGWNSAGDRIGGAAPNANADGFLRLAVGGVPRYIQLFT